MSLKIAYQYQVVNLKHLLKGRCVLIGMIVIIVIQAYVLAIRNLLIQIKAHFVVKLLRKFLEQLVRLNNFIPLIIYNMCSPRSD